MTCGRHYKGAHCFAKIQKDSIPEKEKSKKQKTEV
jgi:hypothetical protein